LLGKNIPKRRWASPTETKIANRYIKKGDAKMDQFGTFMPINPTDL